MARNYNRPVSAPSFQPQAQPVDRHVAVPPSKLSGLANALASTAPALGQLAEKLQEKNATEDKAKGEQLARQLQESGETWSSAIASKKVPPSASPWFRAGVQEQFGRVTADTMSGDLTAWAMNGIRNGSIVSMEDYDAQVQQVRKEWVDSNIPQGSRTSFFEVGFGRNADGHVAGLRGQVAQQLDSHLQAQQLDQQTNEVISSLHQIEVNSKGETWGTRDLAKVGDGLDMLANNALALNPLAGKNIQRATVDGVVAYAKATGDASVLEILNHVHGKDKGILGLTKYALTEKGKATDDIAQHNRARASAEKDANEMLKNQLGTEALTYRRDHPEAGQPELDQFVTRMEKIDPWSADQLKSAWYNAAERKDIPENYPVKRNLLQGLYKHQLGSNDVLLALNSGDINTATAENYMNILASPALHESTLKIFSEKPLAEANSEIVRDMVSWMPFDKPELQARATAAQDEMTSLYLDWRTGAGAEADAKTINDWVIKTRERVMDHHANADVNDARRQAKTKEGAGALPPIEPNHKDATKPVLGGSSYTDMLHELDEYSTGKRNKLSDITLDALRRAGIDKRNLQSVRTFYQQQLIHADSVAANQGASLSTDPTQ